MAKNFPISSFLQSFQFFWELIISMALISGVSPYPICIFYPMSDKFTKWVPGILLDKLILYKGVKLCSDFIWMQCRRNLNLDGALRGSSLTTSYLISNFTVIYPVNLASKHKGSATDCSIPRLSVTF